MSSMRTRGTERPSRTRTARTNGRPILPLSTIPVQDLNLRPGEMSLLCRDCETWCPITGLQTPKVSPHRRPEHQGSHRCPGSNQLLNVDVTFGEWREQLHAVEATATYRRALRQHHKPEPQPPAPLHRLAAREPQTAPTLRRLISLLDRARHAVLHHRAGCFACQAGGRCATGRELEIRFRETQATCTIAREQQHMVDRRAAQRGRTAGPELARARQERLEQADRADRQRHNIPVPAGSAKRTLLTDHERIRRAASWSAPTQGGPALPYEHLSI